MRGCEKVCRNLTIVGGIIAEIAIAEGHFPAIEMDDTPPGDRGGRKHIEIQV